MKISRSASPKKARVFPDSEQPAPADAAKDEAASPRLRKRPLSLCLVLALLAAFAFVSIEIRRRGESAPDDRVDAGESNAERDDAASADSVLATDEVRFQNRCWKQRGEKIGVSDKDSFFPLWTSSLSSDGNTVAYGKDYTLGGDTSEIQVVRYSKNDDDQTAGWSNVGSSIHTDRKTSTHNAGQHPTSISEDGSVLAISIPPYVLEQTKNATSGAIEWKPRGNTDIIDYLQPVWAMAVDFPRPVWGMTLSDDGNILAVDPRPGINNNTAVFEFDKDSSLWRRRGEGDLTAKIGPNESVSRYAVAMSSDGSTVVIGADHFYRSATSENGFGDSNFSISIYEYNKQENKWDMHEFDMSLLERDLLLFSISLSSDGSVLAIHYGSLTDWEKPKIVRVFRRHTMNSCGSTSWVQHGNDIVGILFCGIGRPVSLSSDGSTLAVALYKDSEDNNYDNNARVYGYRSDKNGVGTWRKLGDDIPFDNNGEWIMGNLSLYLSWNGTILTIDPSKKYPMVFEYGEC